MPYKSAVHDVHVQYNQSVIHRAQMSEDYDDFNALVGPNVTLCECHVFVRITPIAILVM